MASDLDQSIINYVKVISLEEQRKDSSSKFGTISLDVKVKNNNGAIKIDETSGIINNGCFFIALCDGLIFHGISEVQYEDITCKITPYLLVRVSEFKDWGSLFDTGNEAHIECLNRIQKYIPCTVSFHSGNKVAASKWKVNQDQMTPPIGSDKPLIRIAVNGHFEFITDDDSKFIYKPRTMNQQKAYNLQWGIFNLFRRPV